MNHFEVVKGNYLLATIGIYTWLFSVLFYPYKNKTFRFLIMPVVLFFSTEIPIVLASAFLVTIFPVLFEINIKNVSPVGFIDISGFFLMLIIMFPTILFLLADIMDGLIQYLKERIYGDRFR